MKFNIERNIGLKGFDYIADISDFKGNVNYTYGILPIKIIIFNKSNVWKIKQTSYILKLINSLPILNIETFTHFKMYFYDKYYGKSKKSFFKPAFEFDTINGVFEIRLHSYNYISLMWNHEQIALFEKKETTVKEKHSYLVNCINDYNMVPIITLFCLFADTVFYPNNNKVSYIKYEKSIVIKDPYFERTLWKP